MVWRPSADSPQSVGVFARVMGAPGDRNLVDLGINAGVTLKAPFKGRDNDVAGLAVGYAQIGSHAQGLRERYRQLYTGLSVAQRRDHRRSDLSVSGHALVAIAGRLPVCVPSGRRHSRSGESVPTRRQ